MQWLCTESEEEPRQRPRTQAARERELKLLQIDMTRSPLPVTRALRRTRQQQQQLAADNEQLASGGKGKEKALEGQGARGGECGARNFVLRRPSGDVVRAFEVLEIGPYAAHGASGAQVQQWMQSSMAFLDGVEERARLHREHKANRAKEAV